MNLKPENQLSLYGHHVTFLNLSKKQKNKYQLINSNLDIDKNEKLILNKINRLIK